MTRNLLRITQPLNPDCPTGPSLSCYTYTGSVHRGRGSWWTLPGYGFDLLENNPGLDPTLEIKPDPDSDHNNNFLLSFSFD